MRNSIPASLTAIFILGLLFLTLTGLSSSAGLHDQSLKGWDLYADLMELPEVGLRPKQVEGADGDTYRLSLNGIWEFFPCEHPDQFAPDQIPASGWSRQEVPSYVLDPALDWETSRDYFWRSTFTVPNRWDGSRVILRFDSVDAMAIVSINGVEVGRHDGIHTAFEFDITDELSGSLNELVLHTVDSYLTRQVARHTKGGIVGKVELFAVPSVHVSRLKIETDFDADYRDATLRIRGSIRNTQPSHAQDLKLQAVVRPYESGKPIKEWTHHLEEMQSSGNQAFELVTHIENPESWNPEHPKLYSLELELHSGSKKMESISERFGFREIEFRNDRLLVNGRTIRLRGVVYHTIEADRFFAINPERFENDVQLFLEANLNFLRMRTPTEELLKICDEKGIFVTSAPMVSAIRDDQTRWRGRLRQLLPEPEDFDQAIRDHVNLQLHSMATGWNSPSLLLWNLANECDWLPVFDAAARAARLVDHTRPIWSAMAWMKGIGIEQLDLYDNHYDLLHFPPRDKPLIYTEWAHLQGWATAETDLDPGIRDYWHRTFEHHVDYMYSHPGVLGGAIFSGIDYFFTSNIKGHPFGLWGILDIWRRPKPEYFHVKKLHSPVRILTTDLVPVPKGRALEIPVLNRHDFSDLVELTWTATGVGGSLPVKAKGLPHHTGSVVVPFDLHRNQAFEIQIINQKGIEVDHYRFDFPEENKAEAQRLSDSPWTVKEALSAWTFTSGSSEVVIDRNTGAVRASREGNLLWSESPSLGVTPLLQGRLAFDPGEYPTRLGPWKLESIRLEIENNEPQVILKGAYPEARGSYTYHFARDGSLRISYAFEWLGVDLKTAEAGVDALEAGYVAGAEKWSSIDRRFDHSQAKEVGLWFALSPSFSELTWNRKARWSFYPEDHIGRPQGRASKYRDQSGERDAFTAETPPWPWFQDQLSYGTNDFRSTKYNILDAALHSESRQVFQVLSDGTQHVRAQYDPLRNQTHLLVADFSNFGTPRVDGRRAFRTPRLELSPGTQLTGEVMVRF